MAVLTPGSNPLESLATMLARVATNDPVPVAKSREFLQELETRGTADRYHGLRRIGDMLPEIGSSPLVILVDQFEEVYSLCEDGTQRVAFIDNLLHAAADRSGHVSVLITLRSDFLEHTQQHQELNSVISEQAVSPNARWVGTYGGYPTPIEPVTVWDAHTLKPVKRFPDNTKVAEVTFSPDGKWLVTATMYEYRFWHVGTWKAGPEIRRPKALNGWPSPAAFTRDGKLVAVAFTMRNIKLFETGTFAELATLEAPEPEVVGIMRFTPRGDKLLATNANAHQIQVWDLQAIGRTLVDMGLKWD